MGETSGLSTGGSRSGSSPMSVAAAAAQPPDGAGGGCVDSSPAAAAAAAEAVALAAVEQAQRGEGPACYRLRLIRVHRLLEDGTLGLLLHSTTVVGFCNAAVEDYGWVIADQIVEINGHRVTNFDEFLDRFLAGQDQGFPIDFSVLRREALRGPPGSAADEWAALDDTGAASAEGTLDSFLAETELGDILGQLQQKFGQATHHGEGLSPAMSGLQSDDGDGHFMRCDSITENPYIQALRKRRSELLQSSEGWERFDESLPSRLATQREDALTMLLANREASAAARRRAASASGCGPLSTAVDATVADCGDDTSAGGLHMPRGMSGLPSWPLSFSCNAVNQRCGGNQAAAYEIQPTPRADSDGFEPQQFVPVSSKKAAWDTFGSPAQEVRMQNHHSLKLGGPR